MQFRLNKWLIVYFWSDWQHFVFEISKQLTEILLINEHVLKLWKYFRGTSFAGKSVTILNAQQYSSYWMNTFMFLFSSFFFLFSSCLQSFDSVALKLKRFVPTDKVLRNWHQCDLRVQQTLCRVDKLDPIAYMKIDYRLYIQIHRHRHSTRM